MTSYEDKYPANQHDQVRVGLMAAAAAAVLWGTAGTAQSFVSAEGPDPQWVAALRLLFASFVFLPLLLRRTRSTPKGKPKSPFYFAALVLGAGAAMALYNICFFLGVKTVGIAVGSAVTLGSAPIWAGILQILFNRKLPSLRWLIGVSFAIVGALTMGMSSAGQDFSVTGVGYCLTAGFSYAFYAAVASIAFSGRSAERVTSQIFGIATVIAVLFVWVGQPLPHLTPSDLAVTVYLGVATTAGAYLLFTYALVRVSAATCVALTLLEPVTAFTLARFVAHEPSSAVTLAGLAILIVGLAVIIRSESRRKPNTSKRPVQSFLSSLF